MLAVIVLQNLQPKTHGKARYFANSAQKRAAGAPPAPAGLGLLVSISFDFHESAEYGGRGCMQPYDVIVRVIRSRHRYRSHRTRISHFRRLAEFYCSATYIEKVVGKTCLASWV